MKGNRIRTLGPATIAAAVATLGVAAPASAWPATRTSFTIDTQFVDGPSSIIAATGPLAACTTALNVSNAPEQRSDLQVTFSGLKVLACETATVTIAWEVFTNVDAGRKTFGNWWVVASDLPGVSSGGGKVMGDAARCTPLPEAQGCILDSFTGSVS